MDDEFPTLVVEKLLIERTTGQDLTPPGKLCCFNTPFLYYKILLKEVWVSDVFVSVCSSPSEACEVKNDTISHDRHEQLAE